MAAKVPNRPQRRLTGKDTTWEITDSALNELFFVSRSKSSTLRLISRKATKVIVEGCQDCTIDVRCPLVAGLVEFVRCTRCRVIVAESADVPTLTFDMCIDCSATLPSSKWTFRAVARHAVYSTETAGLKIAFAGCAESQSAIVDVPGTGLVSLMTHPTKEGIVTEKVVWDGAGHPTTLKEEAADKRDEMLLEAFRVAVLGQLPEQATAIQPQKQKQNAAFLGSITAFDQSGLKHTETVMRRAAVVCSESLRPKYGHSTEEDIREHFDSPETVDQEARECAKLIRESKTTVIFTGAGISTSAKLPDYRGPNGVWTLKDIGMTPIAGITIEQATPTEAHMACKALVDTGLCRLVVSTNVDGLHRRSGLSAEQVAELHGNCFKETCRSCHSEYTRLFNVSAGDPLHVTGRKCDCGEPLYDTIIAFGELLPAGELTKATECSKAADLAIVLGSSMTVVPAASLPLMARKLVICNLQRTPHDSQATIRAFARTDDFLSRVMAHLGISVPPFVADDVAKALPRN